MNDRRYKDINRAWDDRLIRHYGSLTDTPARTSAKWIVLAAAGIVALCLLISVIASLIATGSVFWSAETAKVTVHPRVTQATYGTDNALANISYFHDQCATILTDAQNVTSAKQALGGDEQTFRSIPPSNPIAQQQASSSVQQDQSTLTGVRQQLAHDVNDYNARSATQTASPFKAANLPYRIELDSQGLLAGPVNCH